MKLHTMNLVAAGSPLTDNFFSTLFKMEWGVHNTLTFHDCFLRLLPDGKKKKKDFGPFHGAHRTYFRHTEDQ